MGSGPRDFRILGPLEVVEDGHAVALGGRRQRALLALLLLNPNETLSTARLIDELWGERPPASADKTVQVTVSRLRKALGGDDGGEARGTVVTRDRGYELRLDPDRIDAHRFARLLVAGREELGGGRPDAAAAELEAALGLWRGPPLAELAGEPFARSEIGRLEDLRLDALEELAEAKLALGRHAEVVGQLELLIAEHPYRERLRAQLMLALYRSDRQADALQAYQDARRALVEELGIEPGERLRELERAVLGQDPSLALVTHPKGEGESGRSTSFVGRSREFDALGAGLDRALGGSGGVFLLAGEPGIGKSRLTEELIGRAEERGARVLVGRCWEAGGAPAYWPWVQALRAYVREADLERLGAQLGRDAADLATILPELRDLLPGLPDAAPDDAEGSRFRLLESIAAFLRNVAAERPTVLALDDLHAADAPSLLLLRFVAADLARAPVLIVGCYRDTEVGPELAEALAELAREPAVERIALRGLSAADTSSLLELTMGAGPGDELAGRVHAETQGNPLFATEIARLIESEDAVAGRLPIPQGVAEAIGRRVARQSEACRELLTVASVVGREFDPDVVAGAAELGEEDALRAIDEAVAARLVGAIPEATGRLRFSHILVRDALYHELPAPRRLGLHRAIAGRLERRYAGDLEPHVAELAHHYLAGGSAVADRAVEYARRAGDRAARQLGFEEAARHYASALRVLETTGAGDAEEVCELLVAQGEALSRGGSSAEAKGALKRAVGLAGEAGRPDLLTRAALEYGGRFSWARASSDPDMVSTLERALAVVGTEDSPERARLLARLAGALRDQPQRDHRAALGDEALAMATRLGDPATLGYAIEGRYLAIEGPDSMGEGPEVGARIIELSEETGDKDRTFAGHDQRIHAFWQLGDRAGVEAELDALGRLADELRQPAMRWHVGTGQTMFALMEGRFEDAERLIVETEGAGRGSLDWNAEVSKRIALFVLRRAQGRLDELEDTIRRSVDEFPALLRFRCILAHLYAELGRADASAAAVDELLGLDLANEHTDAEWVFSIVILADACVLAGADAAAKLYPLLLPYEARYAQAPVEGVFGSAARALGVLAAAGDHFEAAERHFDAAIAQERRMGARPWLAHAQHELGAMLARRGDSERARALLSEAAATYRELGMDTWAQRAEAVGE